MSVLLSDTVSDILLETQTVGVRISDDDIILAYKRANTYLNSTYKMPTTERTSDLLVFSGIFEYPKPSDFIGWYEPMRPYGIDSPWFVNTTENELVHTYDGRQTAFKFDRENMFLLVSDDSNLSQLINSCDSLTNGVVAIGGDGSNLVLDQQIYVEGNASFRFTITPSTGTTTITITGQAAVDLTSYIGAGWNFLNLQCPSTNTTALTSVSLKVGTDSSDYYTGTATTRYRGDSILGGWGAIGYDLTNPTTVGSPTVTNTQYVQVTINHGLTGVSGTYRLDAIFSALATYYQLPYYSKYNVKDTDGTYKQNPTVLTDTILCPEDANDVFPFLALKHLAYYNLKDAGLTTYFANLADPYENTLRIKYPSQERKIMSNWYRTPTNF